LAGLLHRGVRSRLVLHHLQYAATASLDATPAAGTLALDDTNDRVPAPSPAMQVKEDPREDHDPGSGIHHIHYSIFYMLLSTHADKPMAEIFYKHTCFFPGSAKKQVPVKEPRGETAAFYYLRDKESHQ
jgi:hypothetical protein